MPSSGARPGTRPHCCLAVARSSGLGLAGKPAGFTARLTGLSRTAWRSESHCSGGVVADKAALAASRRRVASSAEKRAAASGGRLERRRARATWPWSRFLATSSAHDVRCSSTRRSSSSRRVTTSSRDASSRAPSETLTSERRSRIASSSPALIADSALSRHSAALTRDTSDSARAMTPSVLGSGRPSSRARSRSK